MEIQITITYFATLKQQASKSNESCNIPQMTVRELYEKQSSKYDFSVAPRFLLYSINDEFVDESRVLEDQDHVVFIPPVSGG